MKLSYFSSSHIPSTEANSINVVNQADAMSEFFPSIKVYHHQKSTNSLVKEFYGVSNDVKFVQYKNISYDIFFDKSDVIYTRSPKIFLISIFLKPLTKKIIELHELNFNFQWIFFGILKLMPKYSYAIIAISNTLNCDIKKILPKAFITTLPDGAIARTNEDPIDKNEIDTTNIAYIGSFHKGKGVEFIIELAKEMKDKVFHIYGGTSEQINKLSSDAPQNVKFYGFINYSQISEVYRKFSFFLAPYDFHIGKFNSDENISRWISPLKIFEVWSYRKVILASSLTTIKEVCNETNSILIEPNSVSEWKSKIYKINDYNLREISDNGYNFFKLNYSWKVRAEKILKIAEEVN
jgi:glycosyltransferase involved in cell wall biosynthesis